MFSCRFSRFFAILNTRPCNAPIRNFHQSKPSQSSKLYEYRVYQIKPDCVKPFVELSKEWMHIRLKHSPLIGYWTSEIGGINDMVHIWEYDSLSHRAQVRLALANDPVWVGNYFSKILPMMSRQENSLLEGTVNISQPEAKGVYEIEYFNGETVARPKENLLGTFTGLVGPLNTGYNLWFHKTPDDMVASVRGAKSNKGSTATGHSRLLLPTPWSPLQ